MTSFASDKDVAINVDNKIDPSQFWSVRLSLHGRGVKFSIFPISSRVSISSCIDLGPEEARRERDDLADT